jgi:phosphatidylglycerophosphate synthase
VSTSRMDERIEPPLVVLNACHPGAWQRVGGVPLVARTLFHLHQFGMDRVTLLLQTEGTLEDLRAWQKNLRIERLRVTEDIPLTLLGLKHPGPSLVYIDAAHLIDPRLIRALTAASEPTLAYIDSSDREREIIRAGFLRRENLQAWLRQGKGHLMRQVRSLFPEDIDPYAPEIRGPLVPYFTEVHSKGDARKATWILIRSQQKQVMDLPAQFIDPPFENMLTRLLCNTPVTPNVVTFLGVGVGVLVAWLFWHGHFWAGALTMFLVEILDGVDGKLARTTLHYTKLGQYEDLIDYFNEMSWYVALGVGLRNTGFNPSSALLAGLLICSDTTDNIIYTLTNKWYGKTVDFFSPFDRAFRRIAGRRNIYGFMFIIGFSFGYPYQTFAIVAVWAALTAAIHSLRTFQYGRRMKRAVSLQAEEIS